MSHPEFWESLASERLNIGRKWIFDGPRRGLTLVENGFLIFDGPRRGLTLVNLIHENVYVRPLRGPCALS